MAAAAQQTIPVFRIHRRDEFLRHNITTADQGINLAVLVEARATGCIENHFWCHIFGDVVVLSVFAANRIFNAPEAEGVFLRLDAHPSQLQPDCDATTSRWFDLQNSLQDRSVAIIDAEGKEMEAPDFVASLRSDCPEKEAVGASLRWAVVVNSRQELELALQCLPCPDKYLKPFHRADNIPTIRLAKIHVSCEMGDKVSWLGPIPLLFSPDLDATQHVFQSNPGLARSELNKVLARFRHMEHFTAGEAVAYLKKHRPAVSSAVFFNDSPAPPAPKRPRLDANPTGFSEETGNIS
jgi:hypothetical protein